MLWGCSLSTEQLVCIDWKIGITVQGENIPRPYLFAHHLLNLDTENFHEGHMFVSPMWFLKPDRDIQFVEPQKVL